MDHLFDLRCQAAATAGSPRGELLAKMLEEGFRPNLEHEKASFLVRNLLADEGERALWRLMEEIFNISVNLRSDYDQPLNAGNNLREWNQMIVQVLGT